MSGKRTQIFTVKEVPKEYVHMFNTLVDISEPRTRADILAEMVACYTKSRIGDEGYNRNMRYYRSLYEPS